MNELITESY